MSKIKYALCKDCGGRLSLHYQCIKCKVAYAYQKEAGNCCNVDTKTLLWCEGCLAYKDEYKEELKND